MALKEKYQKEVVPALKKELGLSNHFQVPRLEKVVVNIGLGDGAQNAKLFDQGVAELQAVTGQKPVVTRAKKSIAGFKIRQGMPIGAKVTLRGDRMYDFIAKLTGIVLPRIRDFRGLSAKGFDGRGNYNLGLKDQLVFPEINYDQVQRLRGMNITIVTSGRTDMEAKALLEHLGFPFAKAKGAENPPQAQAS
jgi:large subunit ribosomal protein L5